VEPLGHYGLAKVKYTHFTSPIRRYSDLVVHRALFQKSHGSVHSLKETADHISNTERNSADAERDSKDAKLYAFLKMQLASGNPPKYPALVTEVRNFGFFVDVPGLATSGMVHLSSVEDDFYVFDSDRCQLVGRRSRKLIRLGDRVQVQIFKVDRFKKQVDFRLATDGTPAPNTSRNAQRNVPRNVPRNLPRNAPRRGSGNAQRNNPPPRPSGPKPKQQRIPSSHHRGNSRGSGRRRR
jgi:ribonuclease R